jgi:hypothetical protein
VQAEVVEPPALREALRQEAHAMVEALTPKRPPLAPAMPSREGAPRRPETAESGSAIRRLRG